MRGLVWVGTAAALALAAGRTAPTGALLSGLDLAAGLLLLGVGVLARRRTPAYAAVATATGFLWFAADIWAGLALAHRPGLVLLALGFPDGRMRRPRDVLLLGATTLAAVGASGPGADAVWLVLATAFAAVAWQDHRAPADVDRAGRAVRARAAVGVTVAFALPASARLLGLPMPVDGLLAVAYSCAVAGVGAVLALGVVTRHGREADAAIELSGDDEAATLDALRTASAGADPGRTAPLAAAVGLLEDHQRAKTELENRIREVRASHTRLLEAEGRERARLRRLLESSAVRRLDDIADSLRECSAAGRGDVAAAAERCLDEVTRTREDLGRFAAGLEPAALGRRGPAGALEELSGSSPVAFTVRASAAGRLPPDIAATVYFVCAEAVANAGKHSSARTGRIEVTVEDDEVVARVRDDGVGGARVDVGGGLDGLRRRVGAAGGVLVISSPPGRGTLIEARLPCL